MKKLNKTRITAIVAQIIAILSFLNVWQYLGITAEWVNILVGMVMQLLVLLGILNDSTTATTTITTTEENDNDNNAV